MPDAGDLQEGERPDPMAFIKPQITLSVSNDTNMGSEVGMAHSNQNPFQNSPDEISDPVKVGKYRALKKIQPNMRSGSLTILIGAAVVSIQAMGIQDGKVLDEFAATLDTEKIKGIFGE